MTDGTYQLLPRLSDDEIARLTESIKDRGVEVPVVLDECGEIIDGHHRVMIADSLGIGYPTVVRTGLAPHEKRILAVELNVARRSYTDALLAMLGRSIEPDIAERARLRQESLGRTHGADPSVTTVAKGRTVDEVARAVGFGSGRTYERARDTVEDVEREAPDLMPGLARQDFDLREARRLMRERAEAASTRVLSALPDDGGARARADLRAAFWSAAVATRRQLLSLDPELVAESLAPEDEARARELTGDIARWVDTATSGFGRGLRVVGGGS